MWLVQKVLSSGSYFSLEVQEYAAYIDSVECSCAALESTLSFEHESFVLIVCCVVPALSVDVACFLDCWAESDVLDNDFAWVVNWIHASIIDSSWCCPEVLPVEVVKECTHCFC